jgi:8-oxo-dGTP pyrophosphatase MutT (NUDIX family)
MIERTDVEHHIQKYIIGILTYRKIARFRDLRPPKTDTNLFSYHLKSLIKAGFIIKLEYGYSLSHRGLRYVDRLSHEMVKVREQPKIITMLNLTNTKGEVIVQKRNKQPYIDTWTLPNGKLHLDDASLIDAANREAYEKLGLSGLILGHAGDCYIRVFADTELLSTTFAHIFTGKVEDKNLPDATRFVLPTDLSALTLAPAVKDIVELSSTASPFFAELRADWYT